MDKKTPVVILGGGIHGVGVLHDLSSRGFESVSLFEKGSLGGGTSSKSTKLIHGGLRYLERPSQIPLVYECLRERGLLLKLVPDLVKPIELFFPVPRKNLSEVLKIKMGLSLYDFLAGRAAIHPHRVVPFSEALERAPFLTHMKEHKIYSYWDAQTDDKALVRRVADSAESLGGIIHTETEVISLEDKGGYFLVNTKNGRGEEESHEAGFVINCLGPWAHDILEKSSLPPTHKARNNKGVHLLLPDFGLKAGLLLRALDGRVFFVLPWNQKTLIGTTEGDYLGDKDGLAVTREETDYLLESVKKTLGVSISSSDVESSFAGLRWLAVEGNKSLTRTSRESVWGTHMNQNGFILTLYGGKLTSYRKLCEKIGDFVCRHAGVSSQTKTHLQESWKPAL